METQRMKDILAQMQKNLECAICLELLTNPVSTRCDHQFCRFCITQFLQTKRSVPCPLCKVPVTKRGLQERIELGNVVTNVKKLIAAFETDTGQKCTPSKGPQRIYPSIPEDLGTSARRLSRQRLTDKFREQGRSDTNEKDEELCQTVSGRILEGHGNENKKNASAAMLPEKTPSNVRRSNRMSGKSTLNEQLYSEVTPSEVKERTDKSSPSLRLSTSDENANAKKKGETVSETAVYVRFRTRSKQKILHVEDEQAQGDSKTKASPRHCKVGRQLELVGDKKKTETLNHAVVEDNRSNFPQNVDLSDQDHPAEMQVESSVSPETGKDSLDVNRPEFGRQTRKRHLSEKERLTNPDNRRHKRDIIKQANVRHEVTVARQGSSSMKNKDHELVQYLEEGSCGAIWDQGNATTVQGNNMDSEAKALFKSNKKDSSSVSRGEVCNNYETDGKEFLENEELNRSTISENGRNRKLSHGCSELHLPLSPKKLNFVPKGNEISDVASKRETEFVHESLKKENAPPTSSTKSNLPSPAEKTDSSRLEKLSPVSDTSSVSSTQQLMKSKPPVSRTYSKEMQNAFQSEHVRNWADTLPKPSVNEDVDVTKLRGLTTKEKINAKKKVNKVLQTPTIPPVMDNTLDSVGLMPGKFSSKSSCFHNEELAKQSNEVEFHFELPLTPVPRRKRIFKSRSPIMSDKKCKLDSEKAQEVQKDEDPYEFKGGQTPVKSKRKLTSKKGKTKKLENKNCKKRRVVEEHEIPSEINSSLTDTNNPDEISLYETDKANIETSNKHMLTADASKIRREIVSCSKPVKNKTVHFVMDQSEHEANSEVPPTAISCSSGHLESKVPDSEGLVLRRRSVSDVTNTIVENNENNGKRNVKVDTSSDSFSKASLSAGSEYGNGQWLVEGETNKRNGQKWQQGVKTDQLRKKSQKRCSVRQKGKGKPSADGETLSQQYRREMVRLTHKINEAEDYDLMFSTQEALKKMQEEQLKEQECFEDAFGFDNSEEDSSREDISPCGSKPKPGVDVDQQSPKNDITAKGRGLRNQGKVSPAAAETSNLKNVTCLDQAVNSGEKSELKSIATDNQAEELSMKSERVVQKDAKSLLFKRPSVPWQSASSGGQSSRKPSIHRFLRPKISDMIPVSPGREGLLSLRSSGDAWPVEIVPETPNQKISLTESFESPQNTSKLISEFNGRKGAQNSTLLSSGCMEDEKEQQELINSNNNTTLCRSNIKPVQNIGETQNILDAKNFSNNSDSTSKAKSSSTAMPTIVPRKTGSASTVVENEDAKTSHAPHLSLKAKDPCKLSISLSYETNMDLGNELFHQEAILVPDTCIENEALIKSIGTQEPVTVIQETMNFDAETQKNVKCMEKQSQSNVNDSFLSSSESKQTPALHSAPVSDSNTIINITAEPKFKSNQFSHPLISAEIGVTGDSSIKMSLPEKENKADVMNQNSYILINSDSSQIQDKCQTKSFIGKSQETLSETSSQSQSILQAACVTNSRLATFNNYRNSTKPILGDIPSIIENKDSECSSTVPPMHPPSDIPPGRNYAKTGVNTVIEKPVHFEIHSSPSDPVKSHPENRKCGENAKPSSHKRKSAGGELSTKVLKTPQSKVSIDHPVNSAPSRFNFSDSEEDDVLIVRRSKRKCLSLDGSPLKPVVFGTQQTNETFAQQNSGVQNNDIEMIGETEALEVLDEGTEQETEREVCDGAVKIPVVEREVADSKKNQDDKQTHAKHDSFRHSAPLSPKNDKEEGILADGQFAVVTPVGKLKYIDSLGRYVIDTSDLGSQNNFESTQRECSNPSSQRCLFPTTCDGSSSQENEKLTSECPGQVVFTDHGHFQGDSGKNDHGTKENESMESNEVEDQNMTVPVTRVITTDEGDFGSADGPPAETVTYQDLERSVSNINTSHDMSVDSEAKRHTKRGLAKRSAALNIGSLPKHPKGSLSPVSKQTILTGKISSASPPTTDLPEKACENTDTVIIPDTECDEHENLGKSSSVAYCEGTNGTGTRNNGEIIEDGYSQNISQSDLIRKKKSDNKHRELNNEKKNSRKRNSIDISDGGHEEEKKQLEKQLFGQQAATSDHQIISQNVKQKQTRVEVAAERSDHTAISTLDPEMEDALSVNSRKMSESENEEENVSSRMASVKEKCQHETSYCHGDVPETEIVSDEESSQDEEEQKDGVKGSNSSPLTSSPIGKTDISKQDVLEQSLIASGNGNSDMEEVDDDDDDDICRQKMKRKKRQQIASDSDDSDSDIGEHEPSTNNTLSSGHSSQSETLSTQQQEALEGDVAKLHKEIQEYEAKLGKQKTDTSDADHETGYESKKLSEVFVIDDSPIAVTSTAVSAGADDEDSDDLFLSPAPPSPPSRPTCNKVIQKKPKPKRDADQFMKQFQSPGGTVRTKKSLDFTMSSSSLPNLKTKMGENCSVLSILVIECGDNKDVKEGQNLLQKSITCPEDERVIDVEKSTGNSCASRPTSPVITSQKSRLSQQSQGGGRKDSLRDESSRERKDETQVRDLCFVASGMGREENLMVLSLVEKHRARFSSKFTNDVTHVIMRAAAGFERVCDRTLKFFQGVAHRCWVVTFAWVEDSLHANRLLPEEDYEILGDTSGGEITNGPKRSRLAQRHLFSEFSMACVGDSAEMPKETLCDLLTACGAVIVDHPIGLLSQLTKYKLIVRCSDSEDAATSVELDMFNGLYKHTQLLTVMREWVLDSLGAFTLLPLTEYVLNTCENIATPF